ncbi:MAG: SOS response-associated peptidase [Acidobacteria bacterium]|nr:MAG: SOS response-associated peptidase [Acidobacteriota bacterium]MCL4287927.1 SOS response-associated peptidase [Thermoleophilia bacterium]
MCGRFTLTDPSPRRLAPRFDLDPGFELDDRPRFNIAPTDPVVAIRRGGGGRNEAGVLRWGLVPGLWARRGGQRPLINARAETVATQPAFRESFAERRCLIPADGFYEWRRDPEGKQPIWFSASGEPGGELFAFAGVWARLEGGGEAPLSSCALITCPPNALMRPVHDRMPVVLPRDAEATWIDPGAGEEELLALLRPAAEGALVAREVGDAVNDVRDDGPHLLDPPLKLF